MKLELKHLAPYLPYGLKMATKDKSGQIWILECENIKHGLTWWKPILRPLSECIKDLNNENYLCVDSCDVEYYRLHSGKETFKIYPFDASWIYTTDVYENFYEYFFEHHFDVFGLIDQGLAIDINTLGK